MKKIRVVVVDHHDESRVRLTSSLMKQNRLEVLGSAETAHRALQLMLAQKPDVAVVDTELPDMDGNQFILCWKTAYQHINTKLLLLTHRNDEADVLSAFSAGIDSYSLKPIKMHALLQAIQITSQGQTWIDPAIAGKLLKYARRAETYQFSSQFAGVQLNPDLPPLTDRELEVLSLIVEGRSNSQIANELFITIGTVKTHVRNILGKLRASDRTQAAVRALRTGLVV
ncbi:MAG: response regulator transcription factor [Cyanobacteria bacterium P01_H01_bin.15]